MSADLKAIVGLDGGVDLAAFQSLIDAQPGVSLACPVGDLSDAWDALEETMCDLVVIGCGGD